MLVTAAVLKPDACASRRYGPGLRAGIRYVPEESVTASRLRLVLVLIAIILALGTKAPLPSCTTPVIVAVGTWPETNRAKSMARLRTKRTLKIFGVSI